MFRGVENVALNYDSKLLVGDNCTFGDGRIRTGRNRCIEIGNDCMFSWKTSLLAHDGHMIFDINSQECINNTAGECKKTIMLGNHVWVGGEVDILANTEIGSGSICGYRSLIKGKYPNNCIIAGQMASVIKTDIAWSRENICLNNDLFENIPEEYRMATAPIS